MRKRSKYKPRGVRLDTMAWVKSGLLPVSVVKDAATTLKLKNHDALTSIVQGRATHDDIDVLIGAVNITESLARIKRGLGADWREEIQAGQDAVRCMAKRGLERGRFVFTGPEMNAVNLVMEIHDQQLDACTVGELEKALDFVGREIKHRRAEVIA